MRRLCFVVMAVAMAVAALAAPRTGHWTKEQAWEWYGKQPWIRGVNFVPSDCRGYVDIWQEWGFEKRFAHAERELALAHETGFNTVRLILSYEVWLYEHDGFLKRFDRYLDLCARHGMRAIVVLHNDCAAPKENFFLRRMGDQTKVYKGMKRRGKSPHTGGDTVGYNILDIPEHREKLCEMVRELISLHAHDRRILFWNLMNEPGYNHHGDVAAPILRRFFKIAWEVNPDQPLAADLFHYLGRKGNEAEKVAAELSDITSYHCYGDYAAQVARIEFLRESVGRPLINTEWLNRVKNNNVADCYPMFSIEGVGAVNWGLVRSRSHPSASDAWPSLWARYNRGEGPELDFTKWMHDLYRPSLRPYDPAEIDIIKQVNAQADAELKGESLRAKIAKSYKILGRDMWHGYRRTKFDFNGRTAWIVEPSIVPLVGSRVPRDRDGMHWIWNMLWPNCDVERTCVTDLLKRGFHYAYIDIFDTRMDGTGVAVAAKFQDFLVKELGFAPKANLIGISWGGFMAAQYAAAKPSNVAKIYFDNALLTFDGYTPSRNGGLGPWAAATGRVPPAWRDDPRMPVNLASAIAKAGIKVLLVYGTSDIAVKPSVNSAAFAAKFKAADGDAKVLPHVEYGHHPHGIESGEKNVVISFFAD